MLLEQRRSPRDCGDTRTNPRQYIPFRKRDTKRDRKAEDAASRPSMRVHFLDGITASSGRPSSPIIHLIRRLTYQSPIHISGWVVDSSVAPALPAAAT